MNSQIFCLPQKYGWNAITNISAERINQQEIYLNKKSTKPYFKTDLNKPPVAGIQDEMKRVYPKIAKHIHRDSSGRALRAVYTTETMAEFDGHKAFPAWRKPPPPCCRERAADPLPFISRSFTPPMDHVLPPRGTYGNDPETGRHTWRGLQAPPGTGIWQPLDRQEFRPERTTLPPVRVPQHDPNHEKQRWDVTRNLCRHDALAYGFRRQAPGFTGHQLTAQHLDDDVTRGAGGGEAMVATTQATYQPLPESEYSPVQGHKHQGPLSRMVTLTHPFNPFTQQTAYCTVGAKDTQ